MKVVDMHCDTISELFYRKEEGRGHSVWKNDCHVDLERMEKGDYCLQNFALYTPLDKHERPFEYCMKLVDLFYREMEEQRERIGIVRSYEDILENQRLGRMSAMLTIEEGGVCQGETAFLRDFYRVGVRMMTLTWNFKNELAWPNIVRIEGEEAYFEPDTEHGLTEKGIEFVEEMERLLSLIHISEPTRPY